MALGSLARSVVLTAALCGLGLSPAMAAPASCRQLEAALGDGGNAALADKYDSAILRQAEALARTGTAHKAASCGLGLFAGARCKTLKSTMRRMEDNLGALKAQRAKLGAGLSKRERARVLAALAAQGCRSAPKLKPAAQAPTTRDPKPLQAADLHGVLRGPVGRPESGRKGYKPAPGGRAFCVRTCDGYFFPMTRSGDAWQEQKACQAACPAAETRLFHRHGGAVADMRAADTGAPYRELPSAFLFKDKSAPTPSWCGCSSQGLEAQRKQVIDGSIVSFVDPSATPTSGRSEPAPTLPAPARDIPAERRNVRAVGPAFLPDPEAARDRPVPAPTSGP